MKGVGRVPGLGEEAGGGAELRLVGGGAGVVQERGGGGVEPVDQGEAVGADRI
jgi:hypothetical protein